MFPRFPLCRVHNWCTRRRMNRTLKRETFDEEIKVRVTSSLKNHLQAQAFVNDLELSDIVRRALKDYAAKKNSERQLVTA